MRGRAPGPGLRFRLFARVTNASGEGILEFQGLFVELGEDAFEIGPVEADASSLASELIGLEECREGAWDAVEERFDGGYGRGGVGLSAGRRHRSRLSQGLATPRTGSGLALFLFNDLPIPKDLGGILGLFFAEDMRMAADHFFVDFADDGGDIEATFLMCDLGMKKNLEEEITELLGELAVIGAVESVEDFVGLFDQVGTEGRVGLFAIPGTATGRSQTGHQGDQILEGGTNTGGTIGFRFARSASRAFGVFPLRFAGRHVPFRKKEERRRFNCTARERV